MTFELTPSKMFLDQSKQFSSQEKQLISEKLNLAKLNPFRYKSLVVPGFTKVFEIKLTVGGLYSRLVYFIEGHQIKVAGVINRKNDFRDLMKLLYKARSQ